LPLSSLSSSGEEGVDVPESKGTKLNEVARQLAAILAADVVGYSRLMSVDEVGTLNSLKAHRREILDRAISVHHGRIVKTTGDGLLAIFASVVDAVACGVNIQRGMVTRNEAVPEQTRIVFRIGINVGDVILDGEDIFGDGVNIAARLESLCEPGGLCISGPAYDQIRDKLSLAFVDLGEKAVKNIVRAVRVINLSRADIAALPEITFPQTRSTEPPTAAIAPLFSMANRWALLSMVCALIVFSLGAGYWWLAVQPSVAISTPDRSIVVLPLANLSGDPAQDYVADVLTDALTTYLSRIPDSFVIARNTAFTYKGKSFDVKQIGKELGVNYVLDGNVQPTGPRIRVNAQLIDAASGAHLWADQFDDAQTDLLQMQDEIVTRLARALHLELSAVNAARLARVRAAKPDADDLAVRCEAGFVRFYFTGPEAAAAFKLCEQALEIDSSNVRALSILGLRSGWRVAVGQSTDPASDVRQIDEFSSRALDLDPHYYLARYARGYAYGVQSRYPEQIIETERALELNPSFVTGYVLLCSGNLRMGRPEETIKYAEKAIRLSPRDPILFVFHAFAGEAYFLQQQYEPAVALLRTSVAENTQFPQSQYYLIAALALNGEELAAREQLKTYLSLRQVRTRTIAQFNAQARSDDALGKLVVEGLRKAGMSEE
jgi:adenylate cyclase